MIRNIFLLSILVLAVAGRIAAQPASIFDREIPRTFYGGLAAGTNFSQVDGDERSGYHKVGLNAGPLVYVRFAKVFGASMELTYSRKGSHDKHFGANIYGVPYLDEYRLRLNYVEVPVALYFFGPKRLNYSLGCSYARLISSKEEAWTNFPVNMHPELYPFRQDEISYLGGIGYEWYTGWFIQLRYSYSITSVRDAVRIPVGYGGGVAPGQFNNLWSLRLIYLVN